MAKKKKKKQKVDRAMRLIFEERGRPTEVARKCKISRQAIDYWKKVPPEYVNKVSDIIGLAPHLIRPDVFRRPSK